MFSVSATTRCPRPGETDGVHYSFISAEEFSALVERDALLEWAEYAGHRYGTPSEPVERALRQGKVVVLDIDVAGALQVRKKCADAVLVFFTPSTLDEVERRLRFRATEDDARIADRMKVASEEYKYIDRYHYLVLNDDLEDAVRGINAVIEAERRRVSRMGDAIRKLRE